MLNYRSPTCAKDIRDVTRNSLAYALDTVASPDSAQLCCDSIGPKGGVYTSLLPIEKLPRSDVVNRSTMAFTAVGEAFEIGGQQVPAIPDDHAFAVQFTRLAQDLLSKNALKVHPVSIQQGGLDGVLEGLQELREGKVSGVKLVYSME